MDKSSTTTTAPDAGTQAKDTGLWNTATTLAGGGAMTDEQRAQAIQAAFNGDYSPANIQRVRAANPNLFTNTGVNAAPTADQLTANYKPYDGELVAGFTPDQESAFQGVRDLQGAGVGEMNAASAIGKTAGAFQPGIINAAQSNVATAGPAAQAGLIGAPATSQVQGSQIGGLIGASGGASSIGTSAVTSRDVKAGELPDVDINKYLNPANQNVVDTSLAAIEKSRREAIARTTAQGLAAHAFGGSGSGVAASLTNRDYGDTAAATASKLYSDNYNNAVKTAQADLDRRLSGDTTNANNSLTASADNAQNTLAGGIAGARNNVDASIANANNAVTVARANQDNSYNASRDNATNLLSANTTKANNDTTTGIFNAGQKNDLSKFDAGQQNTVGMFNTGQTNTVASENEANKIAGANVNVAGGNLLRNVGNDAVNNGLQKSNALLQTGTAQQTLAQNKDSVAYQQWLAKQQYPMQMLQFLQGLRGTPGSTSTTKTAGNLPGQVIDAVSSAIPAVRGLSLFNRGGLSGPSDSGIDPTQDEY